MVYLIFELCFSRCIHSFWLKHSSYVYCNGVIIIIYLFIIIIGISFLKISNFFTIIFTSLSWLYFLLLYPTHQHGYEMTN
jgi:hypothetical protein